ncbi:hypothetical protein [Phenylobacterium sp.]|jgi:hypothetical protein|uniref:hypothetical protein n=1 Tax=Phenylobacterium sp. TaxID=1871053 RepID=UPI002F40C132
MFELAIVPRGASWVLLNEDCGEVARYPSEAAALTAAQHYILGQAQGAFVLIASPDGEWREEEIEAPLYQ